MNELQLALKLERMLTEEMQALGVDTWDHGDRFFAARTIVDEEGTFLTSDGASLTVLARGLARRLIDMRRWCDA